MKKCRVSHDESGANIDNSTGTCYTLAICDVAATYIDKRAGTIVGRKREFFDTTLL